MSRKASSQTRRKVAKQGGKRRQTVKQRGSQSMWHVVKQGNIKSRKEASSQSSRQVAKQGGMQSN